MKQNQNKVTEVKKVAAEKKNVPKISKAVERVDEVTHRREIDRKTEMLVGVVSRITRVNLNLNSRDMSVKGLAGAAALTCGGVVVYQLCKKEPNKNVLRGCSVGTALFGAAWYGLNQVEKKNRPWRELPDHNLEEIRNDEQSRETTENGHSTENPTSWKGKTTKEMLAQVPDIDPSEVIALGLVGVGLINFLVAGAGVGKSILMYQIALAVANGEKMAFLPPSCPKAKKMDVVFYRLENYPGELSGKYGDAKILNLPNIRWVLNANLPDNTTSSLLKDIEECAKGIERDSLICIDPVTKLQDYNHAKFISSVEAVQQEAKAKGVILTFLVSAHVDEISNWKILTSEKIKGGDKLIQQAGAVFALRNERNGSDFRFIQVLKAPKGQSDPVTVTVCEILKEDIDEHNKNIYLKYIQEKKIEDALPIKPKANSGYIGGKKRVITLEDVKQMKQMVLDGKKVAEIAKHLKVSPKTVYKYIKVSEGESEQKEKEG
jgi:Mor family transcriptional regulator